VPTLNETLNALENIVDLMDDILDVLKDNVSLVLEMAQDEGLGQTPESTLAILREVALVLEELPWALSEVGLSMATAPHPSCPENPS